MQEPLIGYIFPDRNPYPQLIKCLYDALKRDSANDCKDCVKKCDNSIQENQSEDQYSL